MMRAARRRWWRFAFAVFVSAMCGTIGACNTIAGLGRDLTAIGEGTAQRIGNQDAPETTHEIRAALTD